MTGEPLEVGTAEFLDTEEAAAFLTLSSSYLKKLRTHGGGPEYLHFGGKAVRYSREALNKWAEACRRQSTTRAVA